MKDQSRLFEWLNLPFDVAKLVASVVEKEAAGDAAGQTMIFISIGRMIDEKGAVHLKAIPVYKTEAQDVFNR